MTDRDPLIARAIGALPVPEHAPGFWEALEAELADDAYARPTAPARRRRWPLLTAAAVLVAAAGLAGLLGRDRTPTASDGPASTTSTTTGPDLPGPVVDGARAFLTAAVAGDEAATSALVGPGSQAYVRDSGRSVAELLAATTWPDPAGSQFSAISFGPGREVVIAQHHDVTLALPLRYDEATNEWRAEPWAYDRSVGARPIVLATPGPITAGDPVRLSTPIDGTALVAVDDHVVIRLPTTDRLVTWVPTRAGNHQLLAAVAHGDIFVVFAGSITVEDESGSAEGVANLFHHAWLVGDRTAMARYGADDAVQQAAALPTARWDGATAEACEGAAGSVYCTWTRDDGARLVIRVGNIDRPPRVQEIRVEP